MWATDAPGSSGLLQTSNLFGRGPAALSPTLPSGPLNDLALQQHSSSISSIPLDHDGLDEQDYRARFEEYPHDGAKPMRGREKQRRHAPPVALAPQSQRAGSFLPEGPVEASFKMPDEIEPSTEPPDESTGLPSISALFLQLNVGCNLPRPRPRIETPSLDFSANSTPAGQARAARRARYQGASHEEDHPIPSGTLTSTTCVSSAASEGASHFTPTPPVCFEPEQPLATLQASHICSICGNSYRDLELLVRHLIMRHEEDMQLSDHVPSDILSAVFSGPAQHLDSGRPGAASDEPGKVRNENQENSEGTDWEGLILKISATQPAYLDGLCTDDLDVPATRRPPRRPRRRVIRPRAPEGKLISNGRGCEAAVSAVRDAFEGRETDSEGRGADSITQEMILGRPYPYLTPSLRPELVAADAPMFRSLFAHYNVPAERANDIRSFVSEPSHVHIPPSSYPRPSHTFPSDYDAEDEIIVAYGDNMAHTYEDGIVDKRPEDSPLAIAIEGRNEHHGATPPPTFPSAEPPYPMQGRNRVQDQLHPSPLLPKAPLITTNTTMTRRLRNSDSPSEATETSGRQDLDGHNRTSQQRDVTDVLATLLSKYPNFDQRPTSTSLKTTSKELVTYWPPHPVKMTVNRDTCALLTGSTPHPSFPPRRQRPTPLRELLRTISTGAKGSLIVRLPMTRDRPITTVPTPSSTPLAIRSRRRKLRINFLLGLVSPYAFSWDPGVSGSAFQFEHAHGASQPLRGSSPRLEDGSGIWSGQGPGPSLNILLGREPVSLEQSDGFGDPVQTLNSLLSDPSHSSIGNLLAQSVYTAPDPHPPLHPSLAKLISKAFSMGFALGAAYGNTRVHPWESTSGGSGSQQPSLPRAVQEEVTSISHNLIPDTSLGLSHDGANWFPDLLPAGTDTVGRGTFSSSETQLPLDALNQSTSVYDTIENTWDPIGGASWGSWVQPPDVDADPIVSLQDPGESLAGDDHPPGSNTDLATAVGQFVHPSDSILPASEIHPAQPVTATATESGSQSPRTQLDDRGNEVRYSCNRCNKRFRRPYLLDDHISTVHEQIGRHICAVRGCKGRYANHSGLMRHLRKAHPHGANLQGTPPLGFGLARGGTLEQRPEAESSNGGASRRCRRSLNSFVHYAPSATRHRSRRRDQ